MSTLIKYESQDLITTITIDRNDDKNAINGQLVEELSEAWNRFEASEDRVAILAANGVNFSFGADTRDLPTKGFAQAVPGNGVHVSKPIICCVQGWVVGGALVLAQISDLCVAADNSQFIFPEAKLGVLAGGMIAGLVGHIPYKVAMEIMLTGTPISAQRAYEVGLVNKVVPVGEQLAVARRYAENIAGAAPLVVTALRDMAWEARAKSSAEIYGPSQRRIASILASKDAFEGIQANKEKRKPRFIGN